jgi:hypothetical protein
MLLALAVLFAFIWVMAFLVYSVTGAAIHVLLLAAAVSAVVHFIRVRRVGRREPPLPAATGPL